ncbi:MAG: metallophosphoesterase [Oscillospiraceae bacterium]|nr:metallophosphoesterase [Oscillospiraceae bacterium]
MATYVMSDIHGQLAVYLRMLVEIGYDGEHDRLYILGDVIDRGPQGVAVLKDCMRRPGVTLLLGNHEDILLRVLHAKRTGRKEAEWQKAWTQNGGDPTREDFFAQPVSVQRAMEEYLHACPLNITIQAGESLFLAAHACPLNLTQEEYDAQCRALRKECAVRLPTYREFLLWQRVEEEDAFPEGVTALFGHTPTCFYQRDVPYKFWKYQNKIGLDCGLAGLPRGNTAARLGCLRLEDMQEWYISP